MPFKWAGEAKQYSSDREGFSNPAIYTFAGNKVGGFVREMIQNSLDAGERIHAETVSIRITKKIIDKSDFPLYHQWLSIVKAAADEHPSSADGAAIVRGIEEDIQAHNGAIPVLVYEDFSTPGLDGQHDGEGTFNALVRSKGTSDHGDVTNPGGSFGIGKNAAWSMSKARTVIFSSLNADSGVILQGIAELASHTIENQLHGAKVYFGQDDRECSSIRSIESTLSAFARQEYGLSQFVMFPHLESSDLGWKSNMAETILRNYWPALQNEELQVEIIDETEDEDYAIDIRHTRLPDLMQEYFDPNIYRAERGLKPEGNPMDFWQAYINGQSDAPNLDNLGRVSIKVSINDQCATPGICYIRRGMVIDVNRKKMRGFGDMKYCATVECLEQKGNELLRMMEPPAHDEFSLDIIETRLGKSARKKASKALKDIVIPIQTILEAAREEHLTHTDRIAWVDDLFNAVDSTTGASSRGDSGQESNRETTKRILGDIPVESISFNSDSTNKALMADPQGSEEEQNGGNDSSDGSGNQEEGPGNDTDGRNDSGGGNDEGTRSKKSKLPHRIFFSGSSESGSEYTIATLKTDEAKTVSGLLCQKGDKGKVTAFNLVEVTNSDGTPMKFRADGDRGFVIEDIPTHGKIKITVREGHKSNYILTDRTP